MQEQDKQKMSEKKKNMYRKRGDQAVFFSLITINFINTYKYI